MICFSFSAILIPVFLSHKKEHLNALNRPIRVAEFVRNSKTSSNYPKRETSAESSAHVSSKFFDDQASPDANHFIRRWLMSGPDLCESLRREGLPTSGWVRSAFDIATFECTFQRTSNVRPGATDSSFFLVVRGDLGGSIASVRIQIARPLLDSSGNLDPETVTRFSTVLRLVGIVDANTPLSAISHLRDFNEGYFGAKISFVRELSTPQNYNFLLLFPLGIRAGIGRG
jgi:hypothetical protein